MMNEIYGFLGMVFLLVAFALNFLKKIKTESKIYSILNIIGSMLLEYYSYLLNSTPFIILQSIWGLFAVYNLIINK